MRRLQMTEDLYTTKRSLELEWQQEHLNEGRYTLDMVRIDHKVRQVISDIKMREAELAQHVNKVDDSAPQVSVAT